MPSMFGVGGNRLGVLARLRAAAELARDVPDRVRTGVHVFRSTGMAKTVTAASVLELVRGVARGRQNPALLFRVYGKGTPDKVAVVDRGEVMTYGELDRRIDRVAAALAQRGVGRRARVVVMMKNRREILEVSNACARMGGSVVTIAWRSTAEELAYVATHSGARALVIEGDLLAALDVAALPPAVLANVFVVGDSPGASVPGARLTPYRDLLTAGDVGAPPEEGAVEDDSALVVYTSGTTGKPKGAVRKFPKNAIQGAMRFFAETPLRVDDVHLVVCPLYHSTAFGFMTLSQVLGGVVVIADHFDPEGFLRAVEQHRITTTAVVPTMLQRILDLPPEVRRRYDTSSLRVVFSGGAALPAPLAIAFMDAFGDIVWNFYGATETGLVTLASPADLRAAPGTIGRALPGNDIRLLDEQRREVRAGAVGELFVKNDLLIEGYHGDPRATSESKVGEHFSVGDLARRDTEGRYFLEGRKRDMIISGGVNVYPAEIESVLEQHPDLVEVAVVGIPDRDLGERVRAFVVARSGREVDPSSVKTFARARLSGAKVPRDVVVLSALPRNPTGKVLKRELREREV